MPKRAKASLEKTKETEIKTPEAPKSYEELEGQKAALFAHMEEKIHDFGRYSLPLVAEHSVDDALDFFEKNRTELSFLELMDLFYSPSFVRRHLPFSIALQNKVRELGALSGVRAPVSLFVNNLLSAIESTVANDKGWNEEIRDQKKKYAKYAIDFPEQENGDLDAINTYYSNFIKEQKVKAPDAPKDTRSRGERLAENNLLTAYWALAGGERPLAPVYTLEHREAEKESSRRARAVVPFPRV